MLGHETSQAIWPTFGSQWRYLSTGVICLHNCVPFADIWLKIHGRWNQWKEWKLIKLLLSSTHQLVTLCCESKRHWLTPMKWQQTACSIQNFWMTPSISNWISKWLVWCEFEQNLHRAQIRLILCTTACFATMPFCTVLVSWSNHAISLILT